MTFYNGLLRIGAILPVLLSAVAVCGAPFSDSDQSIRELIQRAGNAYDDATRLDLLKQLRGLPGLDNQLQADADRLIAEVDRWIHDRDLSYFRRIVGKEGDYEFGIDAGSPLYPLTCMYRARMITWVTLENSPLWKYPKIRREWLDRARHLFEEARRAFPENRVVRMYLGEPIPPHKLYPPAPGAPEWAIYQRESLERLADITEWWIDNRMQDNGEYGGGWEDDCEMWRWWTPVLIGFDDPKIVAGQSRFSSAVFSQEHMKLGYTDHLYDVEHTSEEASDGLTPMMHLEPDSEVWIQRTGRLAELVETLWTGTNERGYLQFKSTYLSADKVEADPRKACDTVYHCRVVQPVLVYWQRTGDERLGKLLSTWMDTWVEATARAERGKPAGVIPSAIHWPDGGIGGLGVNWWDPENHTRDPLYVWPSAMSMMTHTLLLTHHMTRDPKYMAPIRSMAQIRLDYLKNPPQSPPSPGSVDWCASKLGGFGEVAAKYAFLTGSVEFDELLEKDAGPYVAYRLHGDHETLVTTLRNTTKALRINFEGYTSEVRYTDRVLRYGQGGGAHFPALFGENGMYPEPIPTVRQANTGFLYSTVTGDPGSAEYFPMNAVRWLTRPRNIAALVTDTGGDRFAAKLFHFGETARPMAAELYLLKRGEYEFTLHTDGAGQGGVAGRGTFSVSGLRTPIVFELPPRKLCVLRVHKQDT